MMIHVPRVLTSEQVAECRRLLDGAEAVPYTVLHAPGRSSFSHVRSGIASELEMAVPLSDPVKISRLRLTNRGVLLSNEVFQEFLTT